MFEIAEAEAAVFFGDGDTVQAELAHRRPEFVAREPVLGVDLRGQRRDLFTREAFGGFADHVRGFAQREIHLGQAHGALLKIFCAILAPDARRGKLKGGAGQHRRYL